MGAHRGAHRGAHEGANCDGRAYARANGEPDDVAERNPIAKADREPNERKSDSEPDRRWD